MSDASIERMIYAGISQFHDFTRTLSAITLTPSQQARAKAAEILGAQDSLDFNSNYTQTTEFKLNMLTSYILTGKFA